MIVVTVSSVAMNLSDISKIFLQATMDWQYNFPVLLFNWKNDVNTHELVLNPESFASFLTLDRGCTT